MIALIIAWGLTRKSLTVDLLLARARSLSLPFPVPLLGLALRVDKHCGSPYAPAITAPLLRTLWSSAPSLFPNIAVDEFLLVGDNLVRNLAMILNPLPPRTLGWSNATVTNHQPEQSSKHCSPTCLEGTQYSPAAAASWRQIEGATSPGGGRVHSSGQAGAARPGGLLSSSLGAAATSR